MPQLLFVYGTLKRRPTGRHHALLRAARFVSGGSVRGDLYDLGSYPGLVRAPHTDRRVVGEVYELPSEGIDRMLHELDAYEGDEYIRARVYVTLPKAGRRAAWTYLLRNRPPRSARPIASGRYVAGRGAA